MSGTHGVDSLLAAFAARGRIDGGCDDCHAYQEMAQAAPGVWMLNVFHDDGCPELVRRKESGG